MSRLRKKKKQEDRKYGIFATNDCYIKALVCLYNNYRHTYFK
jgi:hypothetical protein